MAKVWLVAAHETIYDTIKNPLDTAGEELDESVYGEGGIFQMQRVQFLIEADGNFVIVDIWPTLTKIYYLEISKGNSQRIVDEKFSEWSVPQEYDHVQVELEKKYIFSLGENGYIYSNTVLQETKDLYFGPYIEEGVLKRILFDDIAQNVDRSILDGMIVFRVYEQQKIFGSIVGLYSTAIEERSGPADFERVISEIDVRDMREVVRQCVTIGKLIFKDIAQQGEYWPYGLTEPRAFAPQGYRYQRRLAPDPRLLEEEEERRATRSRADPQQESDRERRAARAAPQQEPVRERNTGRRTMRSLRAVAEDWQIVARLGRKYFIYHDGVIDKVNGDDPRISEKVTTFNVRYPGDRNGPDIVFADNISDAMRNAVIGIQ